MTAALASRDGRQAGLTKRKVGVVNMLIVLVKLMTAMKASPIGRKAGLTGSKVGAVRTINEDVQPQQWSLLFRMTAMLDTLTGKQAGRISRRRGVARLASEAALRDMIVTQVLVTGRPDGQTRRSHGVASMRMLAVHLFSMFRK